MNSEAEPNAGPPVQASRWVEDKQLSIFVLLALTVGALYLTYRIFRPFLSVLFVALVLAIGLSPVHRWVRRHIRSRNAAALITTTLAISIILLPFILLTARLVTEATSINSSVLEPLGNAAAWPRRLDPLLQKAANETGLPAQRLRTEIATRVRELGAWFVHSKAGFGRAFVDNMKTIALGCVFLFPLLRGSDEFRLAALSMLPLSPQRARELAFAVNQAIIADIYGMFVVAVAEGSLIAIGFWITGVSAPLFWGVIATFLSCLPFVGVSLVWIPACILLALHGEWARATLLLVWCILVVATAEGFLRSTIVSGHARVNSMLITLSTMGGVVAFGAVGLFAGPVVLVVLATLVRILREEHTSLH